MQENGQVGFVLAEKLGWQKTGLLTNASLLTVIAPVGIAVGSSVAGKAAEKVGGIRNLLLLANSVAILANLLKLFMTLPTILIGRLVFGISTGLMNFSFNKALNDSVPASQASKYGLLVNSGICLGLFAAGVCSLIVPIEDPQDPTSLLALREDQNWRIVYSVPIAVEVVCLLLLS